MNSVVSGSGREYELTGSVGICVGYFYPSSAMQSLAVSAMTKFGTSAILYFSKLVQSIDS